MDFRSYNVPRIQQMEVSTMIENTYTKEQMNNSKRLVDMIVKIPAGRQPEAIRLIEAMILGAEIANRLNTDESAKTA